MARFGWYFYLALSLTSLVALGRVPVGGHYDIFIRGTRAFLELGTPYGVHFNDSGWWFYSPSCALFFFSIFSPLPDALGQLAYVGGSWALFTWGLRALLRRFAASLSPRRESFFWFILTSEMIGAILNARIEIAMTGVLFWAWLAMERERTVLAGVLTAMVTVWKFLTLPVAGLWMAIELLNRRSLRFVLGFFGGAALWLILPFAVRPVNYMSAQYGQWLGSIGEVFKAQDEPWRMFQHVYRFLDIALGIPLRFAQAQMLGAAIGGLLVAIAWQSQRQGRSTAHLRLLGLGLGMAHLNAFALTSQSAAYVSYAPLLLAALLGWESLAPRLRRMGPWVIGVAYFSISLLYSDVVPRAWKAWAWMYSIKSLGIVLLAVWVSVAFSRARATEGSQTENATSRGGKGATNAAPL